MPCRSRFSCFAVSHKFNGTTLQCVTCELVHLIAEQPGANLPAPGNQHLPGFRDQRGAGGVVGEVNHHQLRAWLDQVLQQQQSGAHITRILWRHRNRQRGMRGRQPFLRRAGSGKAAGKDGTRNTQRNVLSQLTTMQNVHVELRRWFYDCTPQDLPAVPTAACCTATKIAWSALQLHSRLTIASCTSNSSGPALDAPLLAAASAAAGVGSHCVMLQPQVSASS
jgi:hypothetical protein